MHNKVWSALERFHALQQKVRTIKEEAFLNRTLSVADQMEIASLEKELLELKMLINIYYPTKKVE